MPLLIPLAWVVAFLALLGGRRGLREAALLAFLAVTVAVLVITEALSPLGGLSFGPVAAVWAAAIVVAGVVLRARLRDGLNRLRDDRPRLEGRADVLVAVVLGAFAVGTLLSALLYPTTNYDSLTYHMPRVFFWFQNHSVAHYPTSEGRQLFSSALVEYFVLQLKVLAAGSDRLANLVQWLSYVFSVVAVSLLALKLGAGRRGQQVAAVAAAVTPMAVLQASSTQNDLTCALWSLTAVWLMVGRIEDAEARDGFPWAWVLATGSALALATQSKPTAYLFLAPFVVWFAIELARKAGAGRAAALAGSVALVFLVLNAAWYAGNIRSLGADPLGLNAPGNTHILVKQRTPEAVFTNAVKNASMELGTPSPGVNAATAGAVVAFVRLYGGNPENPLTEEAPAETYQIDSRVVSQDVAPAPLTVLLVLGSAVLAVVLGGQGAGLRRAYVACVIAAFVLTAGLITWNHFVNRVLLGALMLGTPLVGVAIEESASRGRGVLRGILYTLLGLSVLWGAFAMVFNSTDRLVPLSVLPVKVGSRDVGFWNTSYDDLRFRILVPQLEAPMKRVATRLRQDGVGDVGLDVRVGDFPIFPLLALLPDRQWSYVRHVVLPAQQPAAGPQAIVEVVPATDYPAVLGDGTLRGTQVLEPQQAGDVVILLYRPR